MTDPARGPAEEFHPQRCATSDQGMVATQHWAATDAGAGMLQQGGNAVDAAVAAAFALGVCEPQASGIGGQTMVMFRSGETHKTVALDGATRAPHRTPPAELSRSEQLRGHRATTVPSTVAVLGYLLETGGSLPLSTVLAPAIELCEQGYPVSALLHKLMNRELKHLRGGTAAHLFLKDGRRVMKVGETLRQPALGKTLRRLADHGWLDFYQGEIAQAVHDDMEKNDGLMQLDDLAQVPLPIERRPLTCRFASKRVFTFGPPGAGRTLVQMLHILEQFTPKARDPNTPRGALVLCEVIRRANLDRRDRPFDPSFYPQTDDRRMMSEDYAKLVARQIRARVRAGKAGRSAGKATQSQRRPSSGETTHVSAMDAAGNVVSLTQSIERVFGSFAANPELGFLYNNYMSAFELEDITHPYYMRPNAVPWASVAPTIVMRGRNPWLAIGSPGSERIASAIAQVLLRLESQSLMDAITAPRLHCSLQGEVRMEASRMRTDIPELLRERGFTAREIEPFSFYLGCVQAVAREGGRFIGVADLRRDGSAAGP